MDLHQLWTIVSLPDNVPIVLLLFVVPFYTWYGLRQAHAKILGVVYNKVQVDSRRNDYYGYYSYYHEAELPEKTNGNGKKRSGGGRRTD